MITNSALPDASVDVFIRAIRAVDGSTVIVVTDAGDHPSMKSPAFGADFVLSKPTDPASVLALLRNYETRRAATSRSLDSRQQFGRDEGFERFRDLGELVTDIERKALAGQHGAGMAVEEEEQIQIARRLQTREPVEQVSHALARHTRSVHLKTRREQASDSERAGSFLLRQLTSKAQRRNAARGTHAERFVRLPR